MPKNPEKNVNNSEGSSRPGLLAPEEYEAMDFSFLLDDSEGGDYEGPDERETGHIVLQSVDEFEPDPALLDDSPEDINEDANADQGAYQPESISSRRRQAKTQQEIFEEQIKRKAEREKRERAAARQAARNAKKQRKLDREKYIEESKWTKERAEEWSRKLSEAANEGTRGAWLSDEEREEAQRVGLDWRDQESEQSEQNVKTEETREHAKAEEKERDVQASEAEQAQQESLEDNKTWVPKRYKFSSPHDVWDYTWAASEVMHYEKNTVVGSRNLELKLSDDVPEETPDLRRQVLIEEHWKWVKEVLATDEVVKFHDREAKVTRDDQRRVRAVYVDYLDWMEQPGNEKKSFTEYLDHVKPICNIEPTEDHVLELEETGAIMNNELLITEDAMELGRRYYSEDEVGAMMRFYQSSIEQVAEGWREQGKPTQSAKETTNEESDYDDLELDDAQEANTEKTDERESGRNKPVNLNVLLPGEDGIRQLQSLVDYCTEAYEEYKSRGNIDGANQWREQISLLKGHIALSKALLAANITEREKRAEIHRKEKDIVQIGEKFNTHMLIARLVNSGDLDLSQPILEQLQTAEERYQALLNQAVANDDSDLTQLNLGKLSDIADAIFQLDKNPEVFQPVIENIRAEEQAGLETDDSVAQIVTTNNETGGEATA